MTRPFSLQKAAQYAGALVLATSLASVASARDIVLTSGPSGGTFEVVSAAAIEILQRDEAFKDVNFSIIPGGSSGNAKVIDMGKADMGVTTADTAARFAKESASLRGLMALYPNTMQVWASESSGVKDLDDLSGKKMTYGQPGSGPYQPGQDMLKLYGMTDKVTVRTLSWGAANDQLRDGNIDAVFWTTSFPQPTMVDTMTSRDIHLLQLNPEKLAAFKNEHPGWIDVVIPAGTYANQEKEVTTLGSVTSFFVSADMPDELVYNMAKSLYENLDDFQRAHRLLSFITKDTVASDMGVPLHPGAKRYYEEAGITTD